jgi:serine/threonine-protein kinase
MAPELAAGDAVDARTDVFLVGATLHHVLTGQVRHTGRTLTEVLRAAFVCADARYGDDVPEELARLATWATQRDPAARPSSVAVLRRGLADFAAHRAAAALAEEARTRVQALRELLGPDPASPIGDLPGAYRLGAESRFGFTQALAQWPESPGARAGLAACLTTLAELELRQGNTAGARALLVELDGIGAAPPAELLGRIEALEVAREAERSRSLELERLARDLDSSVSRRERLASIGVVGAIAIAVGLVVSFFPGSASPLGLVVFACAILAATVLLAGVFRGRLLGNAFARRVVLLALAGGGGLLANRLAGLALGAPVTATLTHDLILMAVTFLAGGCLLDRAFLFGAGVFLAATPLPLLGVLSATSAFTLSSVLALLGTVFLWWRARGGKVPPRS